jgi:putative RNA 2'-phosphotransferase
MKETRLVKISKYLSYHLRHHPHKLGLKLESGGWVSVVELLDAAKKDKFLITYSELKEIVANNDKKRFSFDTTETHIRANQGHSVEVDLQLEPVVPPDVLYHGTSQGAVQSILEGGLQKMSRHHVHLSFDIATAKNVGSRRGRPVIFAVDALTMHQDGYLFYRSNNGVWLVDLVPPNYLKLL